MGFLSSLKNIVLFTDIFGQGIQLKINKKQKSKTLLGGLLSISMFLLLSAFFYYNAQDVIYKTNPQISIEEQININYPEISLDKYTFPISFALTNFANYPIYKPNYFTYTAKLVFGLTIAETMDELYLNFTNCKKENFPLIAEEEYKEKNIDAYFCLDNQNFTIYGSWSSAYLKYISIQISICQERDDCAPYDEILNYLNSESLFWNLYIQNTNINPQNTEYPVSHTIANYYKSLKVGSFKLTEVYLRKQKLESEEGFLFQSKNINESIAYDYDLYDDGTLDDTLTLVEFSLMVSAKNLIYHRAYMKIQSVLANVGGLSTVLRNVFLILTYIFAIVTRNELLLNTIFDFDMNSINKTEKKPLNFPMEVYYTKNFKNTLFSREINFEEKVNATDSNKILRDVSNYPKKTLFVKSENERKNFENKITLGFKKAKRNSVIKIHNNILERRVIEKSLSFSFIETILGFLFCGCCRPNVIKNKRKLYDKGYKAFEELLDFTYLIKKIDEFEKLKLILLEKHQIALFNFITKELISLDEEKMKNHEITKLRSFYKNQDNLSRIIQEYKVKIISNQDEFSITEVDNRLIGLLREEYKM
jgi:hypothetical protein